MTDRNKLLPYKSPEQVVRDVTTYKITRKFSADYAMPELTAQEQARQTKLLEAVAASMAAMAEEMAIAALLGLPPIDFNTTYEPLNRHALASPLALNYFPMANPFWLIAESN